MTIELELKRETYSESYTLGELLAGGIRLGYTCEDKDRGMENGGTKVYGETAIPKGRYEVILSFSPHFKRITPEILDVPGFSGIRIHGGNHASDSLGCVLLGVHRDFDGIHDCAPAIGALMTLLETAEANREEVWLTIS